MANHDKMSDLIHLRSKERRQHPDS
ncbi:hypothetical protein VCR1J2_190154 [Vibrio coralliirubri]|nr:hypothetical protein VCR1J2_190154 [Vibrio coralliirubri]